MSMNRRTFLTSAAATAVLASIAGKAGAGEHSACNHLPKNIFYTAENPGQWEKKVGSHVPRFEVNGNKVTLTTKHSMSEEHYIVRHTLILADGTVVGSKTFSHQDTPVSEYELPAGYKGKVFATSFCNKHDLWLAETTV